MQGLFQGQSKGNYHWEPELSDTEIVITAEAPIHLEVLNDRPGITFTRSPVGFFQLGFDDMVGYDFKTGRKVKSHLIPGTMVINCCARNDLESEYIAFAAADMLWTLRDMLMQQGFFDVGRGIKIGSPTKAGQLVEGDSADEWFCTAFTSPFHFVRTNAVTPLNQRILQGINLGLKVEAPAPLQQGIPIDAYGGSVNLSRGVETFFPPPFAPGADGSELRSPTNPGGLPISPHPLNPAQTVLVRSIRVDQPGLRPPSIYGRMLPLAAPAVAESASVPVLETCVKV